MVWMGITVGIATLLLLAVVSLRRRRVFRVGRSVDQGETVDQGDTLFMTGVVFTGAGVAVATTLGTFGYAVMVVGLVLMAIGADRTRHHHH